MHSSQKRIFIGFTYLSRLDIVSNMNVCTYQIRSSDAIAHRLNAPSDYRRKIRRSNACMLYIHVPPYTIGHKPIYMCITKVVGFHSDINVSDTR